MCHSTVFWYTCDHLIPTDTICPFKETLTDHTKTTTKTAYVEDACCLCKQPRSPVVEALRTNLISVQKLTSVFQLESRDGHFPEEVTRFFAAGEYLQWMQPGAGAGAAPATPVPAPVQALTPSPTVVDASPSKGRRAYAQNKKSPSTSKSRQSPMGKQSQNKQSPTPQMNSSPESQPKQNTPPENTLSPSDSLVAEAVTQWERESNDPDNDFTTVNFDAIKSVCELEEQIRLGSLPRGSQIDGSLTVSVGAEFQQEGQLPMQHGLPLSLQQQQQQQQPRGTPYDGTNWGQEGVYLPSENYYFVGDKTQGPFAKDQMPLSLPLSAMDPLNEQQSFSTYTTLDVDESDAQSVNRHAQQQQQQQQHYIERPTIPVPAPAPAPAYFPQSMPIPYEQTQQSPVTHLSPKDVHRLTTSPSRSKGKAKAKSSAAPSVTIIDGSNATATTEHNTAHASSTKNTTTTTKRTPKNNTAKDPTKGIKDSSSSRVTKPSSSTPSSGNKKSSKANTKNPATTTTVQQQQQQQQQPNSRKQWVSIPRPPPEAIIVPHSTQQQLQYTMPSMLPCF